MLLKQVDSGQVDKSTGRSPAQATVALGQSSQAKDVKIKPSFHLLTRRRLANLVEETLTDLTFSEIT